MPAPTEQSPPLGRAVEQLLRSARDGCPDALGTLFNKLRWLLLAQANQQLPADLKGKAGASDLVQDTFLEAHAGFAKFRGGSEAELKEWLGQILRNNCRNFIRAYRGTRKRNVQQEASLDCNKLASKAGQELMDHGPSPSAMAARNEDKELVDRALAELSQNDQDIIQLHHMEQQGFSAIARLLEISEDAAQKRFARAILRLQARIEQLQSKEQVGRPVRPHDLGRTDEP
jgi:RNA polymerase sigma-70 factor (ECF subfamily)